VQVLLVVAVVIGVAALTVALSAFTNWLPKPGFVTSHPRWAPIIIVILLVPCVGLGGIAVAKLTDSNASAPTELTTTSSKPAESPPAVPAAKSPKPLDDETALRMLFPAATFARLDTGLRATEPSLPTSSGGPARLGSGPPVHDLLGAFPYEGSEDRQRKLIVYTSSLGTPNEMIGCTACSVQLGAAVLEADASGAWAIIHRVDTLREVSPHVSLSRQLTKLSELLVIGPSQRAVTLETGYTQMGITASNLLVVADLGSEVALVLDVTVHEDNAGTLECAAGRKPACETRDADGPRWLPRTDGPFDLTFTVTTTIGTDPSRTTKRESVFYRFTGRVYEQA
jgi:hypothetical protein